MSNSITVIGYCKILTNKTTTSFHNFYDKSLLVWCVVHLLILYPAQHPETYIFSFSLADWKWYCMVLFQNWLQNFSNTHEYKNIFWMKWVCQNCSWDTGKFLGYKFWIEVEYSLQTYLSLVFQYGMLLR